MSNKTTLQMTYYPDITQKQPANKVRDAVVVFANSLATELTQELSKDIAVQVAPVMSVPDQFRDILEGRSAIALMKPVAYVFAHLRNSRIVPACVAHRPIDGNVGTSYFAQVYAHRDTGLSSLADLLALGGGRLRMAYGDRFSTSNFLIPAAMLAKAGIHPFLHFVSTTFTGGHDLAAEEVFFGRAEVGAGHDGVIKILAQTHPEAENILVRLSREDIHSDPVVVNTEALPEGVTLAHIQGACERVAKQKLVQSALDLFWGWVKDLSATRHQNYASIENALKLLHLNERDMLS